MESLRNTADLDQNKRLNTISIICHHAKKMIKVKIRKLRLAVIISSHQGRQMYSRHQGFLLIKICLMNFRVQRAKIATK